MTRVSATIQHSYYSEQNALKGSSAFSSYILEFQINFNLNLFCLKYENYSYLVLKVIIIHQLVMVKNVFILLLRASKIQSVQQSSGCLNHWTEQLLLSHSIK